MDDHEWTAGDVDELATAFVSGTLYPVEVLARLGPTPPDEFLTALGLRVFRLRQRMDEDEQQAMDRLRARQPDLWEYLRRPDDPALRIPRPPRPRRD